MKLVLDACCTGPVAIMLLEYINSLRNSSSENGQLPYCTHIIHNYFWKQYKYAQKTQSHLVDMRSEKEAPTRGEIKNEY